MTSLASLANRYGNLHSGLMSATLPKPDARVGDEATILNGRDREPARVVGICLLENGKVGSYLLQAYDWTMDSQTEGYAKTINWDKPRGTPQRHQVVLRGKMKGTVVDALIGAARPFYDRSF